MEKKLKRSSKKDKFFKQEDDDLIICRCEEISKGEIRKAIYDGMYTMNELKRYLRVGMGLCQGRTCTNLVKRILAQELDLAMDELKTPTARAPLRPIKMKVYANDNYKK